MDLFGSRPVSRDGGPSGVGHTGRSVSRSATIRSGRLPPADDGLDAARPRPMAKVRTPPPAWSRDVDVVFRSDPPMARPSRDTTESTPGRRLREKAARGLPIDLEAFVHAAIVSSLNYRSRPIHPDDDLFRKVLDSLLRRGAPARRKVHPAFRNRRNPLFALPDRVRRRIWHFVIMPPGHEYATKFVRMQPFRPFLKEVWLKENFQSVGELLRPARGALHACAALRANILAFVLTKHRFHFTFSPYLRPITCASLFAWMRNYGGLMQYVSLELDLSKLDFGPEPAATGLYPGTLNIDRLVEEWTEIQLKRVHARVPMPNLVVLARRYHGLRPPPLQLENDERQAKPIEYCPPRAEYAAVHPLTKLSGSITSLRLVGFSQKVTDALLWELFPNVEYTVENANQINLHCHRYAISHLWPFLPQQASVHQETRFGFEAWDEQERRAREREERQKLMESFGTGHEKKHWGSIRARLRRNTAVIMKHRSRGESVGTDNTHPTRSPTPDLSSRDRGLSVDSDHEHASLAPPRSHSASGSRRTRTRSNPIFPQHTGGRTNTPSAALQFDTQRATAPAKGASVEAQQEWERLSSVPNFMSPKSLNSKASWYKLHNHGSPGDVPKSIRYVVDPIRPRSAGLGDVGSDDKSIATAFKLRPSSQQQNGSSKPVGGTSSVTGAHRRSSGNEPEMPPAASDSPAVGPEETHAHHDGGHPLSAHQDVADQQDDEANRFSKDSSAAQSADSGLGMEDTAAEKSSIPSKPAAEPEKGKEGGGGSKAVRKKTSLAMLLRRAMPAREASQKMVRDLDVKSEDVPPVPRIPAGSMM